MTQSILLVVIDTSRAGILYELLDEGHLPNCKSLADTGNRYQRAITPSPWTLPSHANIFTGRRASDHGTNAANKFFDPDSPPLAEQLSERGYKTLALSGNGWVSPQFGFDRGFDNFSMKYDRFWSGVPLTSVSDKDSLFEKMLELIDSNSAKTILTTILNGLYIKYQLKQQHSGGANTTARTQQWIRRNGTGDTPFFYFCSYLEPHIEYRPPERLAKQFLPDGVSYTEAMNVPQESWRYIAGDLDLSEADFEVLRGLYKATLVYVDEQLGRIIDELETQDLRDETTIIVVGDHGENIGDHGLMDHQYSLHQTLLHVPFIISGPQFNEGEVSDLVELRDIYPTILDLAGAGVPDRDGISRNSLLEGGGRDVAISEYLAPQPSMDSLQEEYGVIQSDWPLDRTYRSIQTSNWKLIEASDGEVELYNIEEDPNETSDSSSEHPDRVDKLRSKLDQHGASLSDDGSGEIVADKATQERLANLGYI